MPLLAEVGYVQELHDRGVEAIKQLGGSITEVIEKLVELYAALYDVGAAQINCGMCADFGHDLESIFPEARGSWGDELVEPVEYGGPFSWHFVVCYRDRYYDAEYPEGVTDFRTMVAFEHVSSVVKHIIPEGS